MPDFERVNELLGIKTETDSRCVYGAMCVWWGSINDASSTPDGLPCCPHCGGILFEMESEEKFLDGARQHEADGHPGYAIFVEWMRGRCFKTLDAAVAAYGRPLEV